MTFDPTFYENYAGRARLSMAEPETTDFEPGFELTPQEQPDRSHDQEGIHKAL